MRRLRAYQHTTEVLASDVNALDCLARSRITGPGDGEQLDAGVPTVLRELDDRERRATLSFPPTEAGRADDGVASERNPD